jgi:hypothetical protein
MRAILAAAALVVLVGTQAQASWAENANKNYPVYTGTNAALARAQAGHAGRYYRHSVRHAYHGYAYRRYERW